MANQAENWEREFEQRRSRRSVFKWVGQIAAGASLAGIGLEAFNPLQALGATRKSGHQTNPDNCITCFECDFLGCQSSSSYCSPGYYTITWIITDGCAPNCKHTEYIECSTDCHNPCHA